MIPNLKLWAVKDGKLMVSAFREIDSLRSL